MLTDEKQFRSRRVTYCSSICRISALKLSWFAFRCFAFNGLSSNKSSSNSCDASKFAFLDCSKQTVNMVVAVYTNWYIHQEQKVVSIPCSPGSPNRSIGTTDVVGAPRSLLILVCRLTASRVLVQEAKWEIDENPRIEVGPMTQPRSQNPLTAFNVIIPCRLHFFSQSSGNFKGSLAILCVRSLFVFPLNGLRPNISSYAHTPSDHQSMLYVYPRLVRISGAM